ncbi:MAG: isoprenylcysteine carboxylmethyltransferase family protein [Pseudomonadota bacterium]
MTRYLKWVDLPPVWLAATLVLIWLQARFFSFGPGFGAWAAGAGSLLVAVGVIFIAAALWEMRRHRTTPVPHRVPSALVTSGVFAWSRNPIYLGDALILTGLILRWDATLSLILVPVFIKLIGTRFILPEEARCQVAFGEAFRSYMSRTRRWI